MENIKLIISDDMDAHRRRLERIITKQPNMTLLASVDSGAATIAKVEQEVPDIILMDIEMESKYAGIEAANKIHISYPHTKIILLTVHEDDNIVFAAFKTGIVDYIIKSFPEEEIVEGIIAAYRDDSPIRPMIAKKLRNELVRSKNHESLLMNTLNIISSLTASELEVLKLLCQNRNRRQIALLRSVEEETIKKQVNSILRKFNKRRTKEIVKLVTELQIFNSISYFN